MKWRKAFDVCVYIFAAIGFVLVLGYVSMRLGITKTPGIIDEQRDYFQDKLSRKSWTSTEEWSVLKEAIRKDATVINRVSDETGISSRIIIVPLVVEQLRLFFSDRELFKSAFAPLQILGNQNQFSWGIMGIKQETARQIELNLTDHQSPWHLGEKFAHALDFSSATSSSTARDTERFRRLTDDTDRYYSYLYGALYIKEIDQQWHKAGFPISDRVEILATLYNIGFDNSKPHDTPLSGGAEIEINGTTYSFGSLAQSFYDSDELTMEFPK